MVMQMHGNVTSYTAFPTNLMMCFNISLYYSTESSNTFHQYLCELQDHPMINS